MGIFASKFYGIAFLPESYSSANWMKMENWKHFQ